MIYSRDIVNIICTFFNVFPFSIFFVVNSSFPIKKKNVPSDLFRYTFLNRYEKSDNHILIIAFSSLSYFCENSLVKYHILSRQKEQFYRRLELL